jgi:hypothetical protein
MPARCSMLQRGSISTILSPARLRLRKLRSFGPKPRFGVPPSDDLDFFGDRDDDPDAMLPVTRSIIERGWHYSALDAYRAQYELAQLKREADVAFRSIDVLPLPTTGTIYEKAAVAASMPISVFIRIS